MSESNTASARMFFALWPDDICRARLAREARKLHEFFGGRIARPDTIHMTLLFLGDLTPRQSELAREIGEQATPRSFRLHMAGAGCWMHNKIGWVAPAVTPHPLAQLVTDLRRSATDLGIQIEKRPFTPHVTLLRKAQCRPIASKVAAFEWRVRDFVLLRSQPEPEGSRYDVVARWEAKDDRGPAVL